MEISLGTVSSFTSNIMRWCHDCGILGGTIRDYVFRLVVARFVVLGCAIAALCMVHQKSMTKYICIYIKLKWELIWIVDWLKGKLLLK